MQQSHIIRWFLFVIRARLSVQQTGLSIAGLTLQSRSRENCAVAALSQRATLEDAENVIVAKYWVWMGHIGRQDARTNDWWPVVDVWKGCCGRRWRCWCCCRVHCRRFRGGGCIRMGYRCCGVRKSGCCIRMGYRSGTYSCCNGRWFLANTHRILLKVTPEVVRVEDQAWCTRSEMQHSLAADKIELTPSRMRHICGQIKRNFT
jgi:hypothetical protein